MKGAEASSFSIVVHSADHEGYEVPAQATFRRQCLSSGRRSRQRPLGEPTPVILGGFGVCLRRDRPRTGRSRPPWPGGSSLGALADVP